MPNPVKDGETGGRICTGTWHEKRYPDGHLLSISPCDCKRVEPRAVAEFECWTHRPPVPALPSCKAAGHDIRPAGVKA